MPRMHTAMALSCIGLSLAIGCKPQETTKTTTGSPAATASLSAEPPNLGGQPSGASPSPAPAPSVKPTPTGKRTPSPEPTAIPTATPSATSSPSPQAADASLPTAGESPPADSFKVSTVTVSNGKKAYDGTTYFIGEIAAEYPWGIDGGLETVYYLDKDSWWLVSAAEVVTLVDAQEKVEEQANTTRGLLTDETTPELRRLVETLLDPQFTTKESDDTLVLSNDFMTFSIKSTQKFSDNQADRFFTFRQLEAYRKAGMPPFAHLIVNTELRVRNLFPNETVHTVTSAKGEKTSVQTTMTLDDVTAEEYKKIVAALP